MMSKDTLFLPKLMSKSVIFWPIRLTWHLCRPISKVIHLPSRLSFRLKLLGHLALQSEKPPQCTETESGKDTHWPEAGRDSRKRELVGRHAGLAARDAKTIFAFIRSADMQKGGPTCRVGPRCKKICCISDGQPFMSALLFYCFTILLFHSRYSTAAADVWGWPPEMQKGFHILPRTTAERRFCISDGQPTLHVGPPILLLYYFTFTILLFHSTPEIQKTFLHLGRPTLHVGPPILLFYCFTILLFYSRYSTAAADVWGWPPEMQKSFPRTTTYYSRTYFLHLGRPTLHVGPPILLFNYFTIYYFTPDTVLPRPMFGVGHPRCKKVFHVLPRTTTYCHVLQQNVVLHLGRPTLHVGPPILLFYRFTILLFYSRYSAAAADVWGWPPEMRKKNRRTTTYYHLLPRTTAERIFCISDGQPCMSALLFYCFTVLLFYYFTPDTVLPRPMFGVGRPRCKKIFHVLYHILPRTRTTTYYSRT